MILIFPAYYNTIFHKKNPSYLITYSLNFHKIFRTEPKNTAHPFDPGLHLYNARLCVASYG